MEKLLGKMLYGQLQAMGLFNKKRATFQEWKKEIDVKPRYDRWLQETIRVLSEQGYLKNEGAEFVVRDTKPLDQDSLWSHWEEEKLGLCLNNLRVQIELSEATLKSLPNILSGRCLATEVLFPNSSTSQVEGIYKNNDSFDYCNRVLAHMMDFYVEERIEHERNVRIRVLEIGAGTGGTSAVVLKHIEKYKDYVEEYCYSDLSRWFLQCAEQQYVDNPYMSYRIFNVEKPPGAQGIDGGRFDVVIAANVLHATKNIRQALRNTKATMKENGILLMNEIDSNSLFAHLTFGLLDGWWRYEDEELRIPGCPGLYPESWRKVLEEEGFHSIYIPTKEVHGLGQQTIVAYGCGSCGSGINA